MRTGHPAKQAMARHHINAHAKRAQTSQKPMMVSVQYFAEGKDENPEDEDRLRSGLAKSTDWKNAQDAATPPYRKAMIIRARNGVGRE